MALKINKLRNKVNKIINDKNLGSILTMNVYSFSQDRYGKRTKVLNDTVVSSGAKIGGSGRNSKEFNQETLTLIVPYDLDVSLVENKMKIFTFMDRNYELINYKPIDGIQNSGAGAEILLRLYTE